MELSKTTEERIQQFAREQATKHLEYAELSYFERLSRKGAGVKNKLQKELNNFRLTSQQAQEARDDLAVYMSDYVNDLLSQGYTEEEALRKAQQELAADSHSDQAAELQDRYLQYYMNMDPQLQEVMGLYYGAFVILGLVLGSVTGLVLGLTVLAEYFWFSLAGGAVVGCMLGVVGGMFKHASLVAKQR